jgi:hypothetical protein
MKEKLEMSDMVDISENGRNTDKDFWIKINTTCGTVERQNMGVTMREILINAVEQFKVATGRYTK